MLENIHENGKPTLICKGYRNLPWLTSSLVWLDNREDTKTANLLSCYNVGQSFIGNS